VAGDELHRLGWLCEGGWRTDLRPARPVRQPYLPPYNGKGVEQPPRL
jgi:hypothetical protein